MTRGLYPPDTLSKDDIRTLGAVRRDIYKNAAIGGGFGVGSGLVLHTAAQWARKFGLLKANLNRNTAMLSVLGGGAFGMFLFAARTGKQEVHNLHSIFQVGAVPRGDLDYQRRLGMETARGEDDSALGANSQFEAKEPNRSSGSDDLDFKKLEEIRAMRRRTLNGTLEKGHGLSDSHGGHWVASDTNQQEALDMKRREEMRMVRRRTLSDSLDKGHGLSDSHGGHWVSQDRK